MHNSSPVVDTMLNSDVRQYLDSPMTEFVHRVYLNRRSKYVGDTGYNRSC